jgi:hypothetical protein
VIEPVNFLALAAALAGAGLVLWSRFYSQDARVRRALDGSGRVPMRDVRDGDVAKVVGALEYAGAPLTAPLSGRACACYVVIVDGSVGDEPGWGELVREERRQDFFLREPGGTRALVHTEGAQVLVVKDAHYTSGGLREPNEKLEALLFRHHPDASDWLTKTLRYREGVLEAGEQVAAAGVARWELDPDPGASGGGYREAPRRLVLDGTAAQPLVISDDPWTHA